MRYAVITEQNGQHVVSRVIDVPSAVTSTRELQALPVFADEVLDFSYGQ